MSRRTTVEDADPDTDADIDIYSELDIHQSPRPSPGPTPHQISRSQSWDGDLEREVVYSDRRSPLRNTSSRGRKHASGNTRTSERGALPRSREMPPPPPSSRIRPRAFENVTIREEDPPDDYYFLPDHNVMTYGGRGTYGGPLVINRTNPWPTPTPGASYEEFYEMPRPRSHTPYPDLRKPNPPPAFDRNTSARRPSSYIGTHHHPNIGNRDFSMSPRPLLPAPTLTPSPELLEIKEGLARLKAEVEGQEQFKDRIRRDTEEAMQRRFEDMRQAQELAKGEIEKARLEAEAAAMRRMEEQQRRAEEETLKFQEQRHKIERDIIERFEAEQKAREEARHAEAKRMEEIMRQAKETVLLEMREERKKAREMEEERERLRAEIRAEIQAELQAGPTVIPLGRHSGMRKAWPIRTPKPPRPPPPIVPDAPIAGTDDGFIAEKETESSISSPRDADSSDGYSSTFRGSNGWRVREDRRREQRKKLRGLRFIREELVDPIVDALSGRLPVHSPTVFVRRPHATSIGGESPSRPLDEVSDLRSGDDEETVTLRTYGRTSPRRNSQREFRLPSHPRAASDGKERTTRHLSRVLPSKRPSGREVLPQEDREDFSPQRDRAGLSDGSSLAVSDATAAEEITPRLTSSTIEDRIPAGSLEDGDDDEGESTQISYEITDDTTFGEEKIVHAPDAPDQSTENILAYT